MRLIYKYSLIEELKNLVDLIKNHNDYKKQKGLYIEYPNPWNCFVLKLNEKTLCFLLRNIIHRRPSLDKAFNDLKLKHGMKQVTCYLHAFGCGGWFDIDNNEVHVRWDYHANRFINTLIHEVLHLITYDEENDHAKREKIVDGYMEKPEIKRIIKG